MKFIIVLLFLSTHALAQDSTRFISKSAFNLYENESKSKAVGFLWATIIPGAGHIYADQQTTGYIYLGLDASLIILLSDQNGDQILPIVLLVVSKISEYVNLNSSIDDYNQTLRRHLGMVFVPNLRGGLNVGLKWTI